MTDGPAPHSPVRFAGADGCKHGRWFAILIDAESRLTPALFDDLTALLAACPHAERILIDVPIGLTAGRSSRGGVDITAARACDVAARRVLGRHGSRVFASPIRPVIAATDWASANTQSKSLAGWGLSKQAWAITPRIAATDAFMCGTASARNIIRECHPEICFWGLAGAVPGGAIAHNKKTEAGFHARLAVLQPFMPGGSSAADLVAECLRRWPRKAVARDDIVDALVAAMTAAGPPEELRTLPADPPRDARGLPMEMVYRVPTRRACPAGRNDETQRL